MHPWLILDTVFCHEHHRVTQPVVFLLDLLHEIGVLSLCLLLGLDSLDTRLILDTGVRQGPIPRSGGCGTKLPP